MIFGKGYLGKRIANKFNHMYEITSLNPLDKRRLENFLDLEKPKIVINCIGKTGRPNIDWCETNKEETIESNIFAATNLAMACKKRGIYFVHIGSGCMYQGDKEGGWTEEDEPNFYGPQFYAKTKILSEKIIKEIGGLQLRIRMPIDDHPDERNLIDKLKTYPKIIDIQNSMTTIPHMLNALEVLIKRKSEGIYNMVNPGTISAQEIMNYYKEIVDSSYSFQHLSLKELDKITLGKRSNCILNTDKLKREIVMPEIHEAVKECLVSYSLSLRGRNPNYCISS